MSKNGHSRFPTPIPDWIRDYPAAWLHPDIIAGLSAAAVVIPKAMAYTAVAGLPIQVGLYTAIVPMIIYALLGASRPLSVSTTTTIAILTAAALRPLSESQDSALLLSALATLTIIVGAFLMLAGLARFGFIASFISEPVLIGFKAGIGLVIVLDQTPKLLGIHIQKGSFFHNVFAIASDLPHASQATLALAAATFVLLILLERYVPRLPAPLVAVAAGISAMHLFGLTARGVEAIGQVPTGLPSLTLPRIELIEQLWVPALGIALMSFTETMATGRAFATIGEPILRPNRELLSTGLSNVAGAFWGAMPAGGGTSQTAINRRMGARSQFAALVTAAVALLALVFLAPLISMMPQATLAAIVIVYSVGLIKPAEFLAVLRVRRTEFIWALASLVGVIMLGTLQGILVAIIVSLVAMAYQVIDPPVHVLGRKPGTNVFRPRSLKHPEDETFPGLLLIRLEGRLFFANAQNISDKIRPIVEADRPRVLALDLGGVFDLEYTALKLLTEAEFRNRELGTITWLIGLSPGVLSVIQRSPLGGILGKDRLFFNIEEAVARYESGQV